MSVPFNARALQEAVTYAGSRRQFGSALSEFQATRMALADISSGAEQEAALVAGPEGAGPLQAFHDGHGASPRAPTLTWLLGSIETPLPPAETPISHDCYDRRRYITTDVRWSRRPLRAHERHVAGLPKLSRRRALPPSSSARSASDISS